MTERVINVKLRLRARRRLSRAERHLMIAKQLVKEAYEIDPSRGGLHDLHNKVSRCEEHAGGMVEVYDREIAEIHNEEVTA